MLFKTDPIIWLKDLFIQAGLNYSLSSFIRTTTLVVSVIMMSRLANLIAKAIILKIVNRLSHFAPALVIWSMAGLVTRLAIIGEFGLKVYQQPTGDDIWSPSNKSETVIN